MSERLDMQRLKAEYVARRAKLVALGESFVILVLLLALSLEYENNLYMEEWVTRNFWPAAWLLNGTLVGVGSGLLAGWTLAAWRGRRSRERHIRDDVRQVVRD